MAALTTAAAVVGAGAAVAGAVGSKQAADEATESQEEQAEAQRAAIEAAQKQARADALALFPFSQEALQQGIAGATDILQQLPAQQATPFQAGNLAAQETLLKGLPAIQHAILGLPMKSVGLESAQLPFGTGFLSNVQPTQLPIAQILAGLSTSETVDPTVPVTNTTTGTPPAVPGIPTTTPVLQPNAPTMRPSIPNLLAGQPLTLMSGQTTRPFSLATGRPLVPSPIAPTTLKV